MNERTGARRRAHAAAASAANGGPKGGVSGGRRKGRRSPAPDHTRQYARRKGKTISRIKGMCGKLGQMRVVDVALFVAAAAKLTSMLYSYSRRASSLVDAPSSTSDPMDKEGEPALLFDNPLLRKQIQRWDEHSMPFHSPLLYRREDDDYSFGYDSSYLDYDGVANRKTKKRIRLKGMFLKNEYMEGNEDQLNAHGYALVDDLLYDADDNRESTQWALDSSEIFVDLGDEDETELFSTHKAFEFWDLEEEGKAYGDKDGKEDKEVRMHYFTDDDGFDSYYAFDDDLVRGTRGMGLLEKEEEEAIDLSERDVCTRPSFYQTYHPTCNEFHASLSGYEWLLGEKIYSRRWKRGKHLAADRSHLSKYLSHGYYRDAFLFQPSFASADSNDEASTQWDEVVFKTMRHLYASESDAWEDDEIAADGLGWVPEDKYTFMAYREDMRKDAMLMELLSSSPQAIDVYAHCSMSSVIEFAPTDIDEYVMPTTGYPPKMLVRRGEKIDPDLPLNDYISPDEKLEIALGMAQCLAAMHGYKDGPIAHVDVQMGQFFRGRDGKIKIVDYNRAEPLLYDTEHERYCTWTNGVPADGTYRAPEEQIDAPLTEAIDVYSLGNVFYSLLTGKMVWADEEREEMTRRIVEGEILEIPELYLETPSSENLVRAIKACWTLDVETRPSIFEVVDFLERAVAASVNKYDKPR